VVLETHGDACFHKVNGAVQHAIWDLRAKLRRTSPPGAPRTPSN
jgi:hypothetical protein